MAIAISHITMAGALVSYGADAGRDSSLTDSKNEKEAAATTSAPSASPQLSISPSEVTQLLSQKEELRRQLSLTEQTVQTLTSSLAESNAEAELFRRKFANLELRMEALGLASASKDRAKLEQRLLTAVSDLQLAQKERDQYRDQMMQLNEAMLRYLKTSQGGDAQARMEVETQLRSMNNLVTRSASAPDSAEPSLLDGSVISVKDEWSFVVGNLGEKQGVKIGMPMRVMRNDRKIATLRVVDVRQKICGAVIQEMDSEKEKIRIGDRLQVDA